MEDQAQKFIERKRKKKFRKKVTIILLLLIGVTIGIIFKAPFFDIENILVSGNIVLDSKKIINQKEIIGQNIFLLDQKKLEENILNNSYIKSVTIKKKIPNGLDVKIEERKMIYKIKEGEKYYILNKSLVLMEIKEEVSGLSLIELKGIKLDNKIIGQPVVKDESKIKITEILADNNILNKDKSIDSLEINNINNIILNKGEIKIMLGDVEKLEDKYKKAMNILNSTDINIQSGYIDVSFNGNPVIKKDDTKEDVKKEIKE